MTALGRWSHYVYVIRMDSTLPGLVASGMEVRRRFSEFDVSGGGGVGEVMGSAEG